MFVGFLSRKKKIFKGKSDVSGIPYSTCLPTGKPVSGVGYLINRENGFAQGYAGKADGWRRTRIGPDTNIVSSSCCGFTCSTLEDGNHGKRWKRCPSREASKRGNEQRDAPNWEDIHKASTFQQTKSRLWNKPAKKNGDRLLMARRKKDEDLVVEVAPSVFESEIDKLLTDVQFYKLGSKTCVGIVTLPSGFEVIASSAPVSAENYNEEIGRGIVLRNLKSKVWELEGYRLQCQLATKPL